MAFKALSSLFSKKSKKTVRNDIQNDSDDETASNVSFMMQNSVPSLRKKHLVLDLDETLIHGQTKKDSNHKHKVEFNYNGKDMTYFIAARPGLTEFLEEMQKYYIVDLYTCSDSVYAEAILTKIDAKKYFTTLYSRKHCKKNQEKALTKDLSVLGIDFADIILVDDLERHNNDNPLNSLRISDYLGGKRDAELKKIAKFLKKLAFIQDVRSVKEKYQLFLAGKQFVSESDFLPKEPVKMQDFSVEEVKVEAVEEDDDLTLQLAEEDFPKHIHESAYPQMFFRNQLTENKSKCLAVSA